MFNGLLLIVVALATSGDALPWAPFQNTSQPDPQQAVVIRLSQDRPTGVDVLNAVPAAPAAVNTNQQPQYVVTSDAAAPAPPKDKGDESRPKHFDGGDEAKGPHTCSRDEPAITISNKADHEICYMVELSPSSKPVEDLKATCGPGNGFKVPAGASSRDFCPGDNFVGALTAFHSDTTSSSHKRRSFEDTTTTSPAKRNPGRGTRFEFNFADKSQTWYDVDYEMGLDSSTIAPNKDSSPNYGDQVGEEDILAKVNKAYKSLSADQQAEHAQHGYLDVNGQQEVKACRMDKNAPDSYVNFLQMDAEVQGYVNPGSVAGEEGDRHARFGKEGVRKADSMTKNTDVRWLIVRSF